MSELRCGVQHINWLFTGNDILKDDFTNPRNYQSDYSAVSVSSSSE